MSSRRSAWNRQTWDGVCPGVSCTVQIPRSVSISTPGTRSRSGSIGRGDARGDVLGSLQVGGDRRLGNPTLAGHLKTTGARVPGPSRAACPGSEGGSGTRSRHARGSARPGPSDRCGRACRPTAGRARARRLTWSMARSSWAIEPGSCMPVSTSTTPEPAAIAHALPCGTPGQGSGRRRRQSPGRTRSPRPSSRARAIGADHIRRHRGRGPRRLRRLPRSDGQLG